MYRIVGLEAVAAFFTLEAGEMFSEKNVDPNDQKELKTDKKKKKNKGKIVVLGKGTSILVQFIKDRLRGEEDTSSGDLIDEPLNQWVEKIMTLLDPEDPGFDPGEN